MAENWINLGKNVAKNRRFSASINESILVSSLRKSSTNPSISSSAFLLGDKLGSFLLFLGLTSEISSREEREDRLSAGLGDLLETFDLERDLDFSLSFLVEVEAWLSSIMIGADFSPVSRGGGDTGSTLGGGGSLAGLHA